MGFLFELVFEFFGEVLLQVVFQALSEAGLHFFRRSADAEREAPSPWALALGYGMLGALVGGLSLLVFPNAFLHSDLLRKANLLLGPLEGGLAMALIGVWRRRRGQATIPLDRFTYGFVFGFGLTAVRYVWAG